MDLEGVKAQVRNLSFYYPNYFIWRQDGDIVKAFPKITCSDRAFKAVAKLFRSLGGHYTRFRCVSYFEVKVDKNEVEDLFTRMQNCINRHVAAGKEILGE